MFKILKIYVVLFSVCFLTACEKDEARVIFNGGTAPDLTASTNDANMTFERAEEVGVKLSWTNPEYTFNTGSNSHNVTYTLDIDTVGSNFANPYQVVFNGDVDKSFLVSELNDIMLNQMNFAIGRDYNLEFRINATLGTAATVTKLVSNTVAVKGHTYAIPPKVAVPFTGELWMTGDAAPSGWANPLGTPFDVAQKFTKVSETLYELTVDLPGGGGYKLIQENGVWGSQYHMLDGGTWETGDFELRDSDPQFPGPPNSGTYKIQVDFQKGKFFATKL